MSTEDSLLTSQPRLAQSKATVLAPVLAPVLTVLTTTLPHTAD